MMNRPGGGIFAKRKFAIGGDRRDQHTEEQGSPLAHDQDDAKVALNAQFDAVLSAVRDALTPERFFFPLQSTQAMIIREAPIVLNTIHNPTAGVVTVTLLRDPGDNTPFVVIALAAGQVITQLGLQFPRLAGFVSSGYVTLGGELPAV